MRITTKQALARLQPQGKAKAKGALTLELFDTVGMVEDGIYLFGNSDGGILCPAVDTLPPIIGTWEEQDGEIPPGMLDMLAEYANEVEWYERVGEEMESKAPAKAKAKAAPRQNITTMLTTKWSQKAPYNDMCIFDGKRCATGCNATSAAQIMKHWFEIGYHRGCPPTDSYKTSTNGYMVEALPSKVVFDYKHLVAIPKTTEEKKAVAELMAYLGRTFHSNYTPNGTTATPSKVAEYLRDKLRMGSLINYITAAKLGLSKFENYIYNDLLQGKPVIVAAWTSSGAGHTFIIDGYDVQNDLYHVNWGWGGSYNGWFKMTALNANSTYAFNSNKVAIIGIQPDYKLGDVNGDGEVNVTDAMLAVQAIGTDNEQADIDNDGQVTVTDATLIINHILGKDTL